MIEFDEIEGIEEARQAEEEAEHRKHAEAAYLAKVLELEAVVEERLHSQADDSKEGLPGYLISIPLRDFEYLKKWKEATNVFFCDTINAAILKLKKLLADKERVVEVEIEACEGALDTMFAFLNEAMQLRFHDAVVPVCEALAECFQGERGLCILINQIVEKSTSERRRTEAKKLLPVHFSTIAGLLVRLLTCAHLPDWGQRQRFIDLWTELYMATQEGAVQPICVNVWVEVGWQCHLEDEFIARFQLEETREERVMLASKNWTVQEVQMAIQHMFGGQVKLMQAKDDHGGLEELDPALQMKFVNQPIVLQGVDPSHAGWRPIEQPCWPPEWASRWAYFVKRIMKTTPVTATRLLGELRASFTSRKFQETYRSLKRQSRPGNKAHQEILSLTFNVQSAVLPRYGFEATPKGLMEMRDEMPIFAGLDVWNYNPWNLDGGGDEVVWKVRRDIHAVLDMGQVLPRMQLSGHESMGHKSWLRWAQLNAGVDSGCAKAAELLAQADVLLLCAGAGFSADSGLAVYADVARVGAYAQRGLDYSDICNQSWLRKEPEFFWGFWGQCYNDYRTTGPHEGYRIIHRWVERRFRSSPIASAIREKLEEAAASDKAKAIASNMPPVEKQPYVVKDHPGAFMAFTSNVDAHLWDVFQACEIRECHGNTETYQCASQEGRCDGHWRAPFDYSFRVNKRTMLAPKGPPGEASAEADDDQDADADAPHVGRVRGGGRPDALQFMPEPAFAPDAGFRTNHPKCPFCGAPARPSILMFKDTDFRDNRPQAARWDAWVSALGDVIAAGGTSESSTPRVVILEIGAGGNVTTVRKTSEKLLASFLEAGADANLVRINPELPLGDGELFAPGGDLEHRVTSILSCALESIRKIDAAMPAAFREESG